jgi:hypothetical protein
MFGAGAPKLAGGTMFGAVKLGGRAWGAGLKFGTGIPPKDALIAGGLICGGLMAGGLITGGPIGCAALTGGVFSASSPGGFSPFPFNTLRRPFKPIVS